MVLLKKIRLKRKTIKNLFVWIIFLTLWVSCYNSNEECNYTYDVNNLKEGSYSCDYANGGIRIRGTYSKDTIRINEELSFLPSGVVEKYSFYNPIGQLTYQRLYNSKGEFIKDFGNPFSYCKYKSSNLIFGEVESAYLYIANPEGTSYKIFGIDSNNMRYEIRTEIEKEGFKSVVYLKTSRVGNFTLPLEIEFNDFDNKIEKVINYQLNYTVKRTTGGTTPVY